MRYVLKHAALIAACMAATSAHATNGYFLPGFGIKATGMGGVGIAAPQDSLSAAANPANLTKVGMRGDVGMSIFNPVRSAKVGSASSSGDTSPFGFNGASESDLEWHLIPEMGFSMPLNDRLYAGIAFVGNGGMNTTYENNFYDGLGKLGVDMMQLLVPVSVAYKVNEDHSLGVALTGAVTRFRAYGLHAFQSISSDPDYLTNNGFDYSFGGGVKVGWLGDFMDDRVNIGLSWTSKMYMSKFDKYKGLFAEQGDFDIPENFGIGLAIKPTKSLTVAMDVSKILYSDVASVGNRGPGLDTSGGFLGVPSGFPCGILGDSALCLGEDKGMGFGWRDMTIYKVGVDWALNERWTVRAGYNYGKSPIPNDQLSFNTLVPATVEKHYTIGFTWKSKESPVEISGAYMYVANNKQSGMNQSIVQGVDIEMNQHVLGVALGWVLDEGKGLR